MGLDVYIHSGVWILMLHIWDEDVGGVLCVLSAGNVNTPELYRLDGFPLGVRDVCVGKTMSMLGRPCEYRAGSSHL